MRGMVGPLVIRQLVEITKQRESTVHYMLYIVNVGSRKVNRYT